MNGELVSDRHESMTDYTKLVKALRCKRDDCEGCGLAFFDNDEGWMCQYAAKDDDAAAAIEALQKQLVNALTALHLANEKMGYYGIQPYTEADGEDMISDWVKTLVHEELKQQLPKRGDGCDICRNGNLEEGDTLYKSSDWDGGIGFDYIRDIRFCPICGRELEAQDESLGSL